MTYIVLQKIEVSRYHSQVAPENGDFSGKLLSAKYPSCVKFNVHFTLW